MKTVFMNRFTSAVLLLLLLCLLVFVARADNSKAASSLRLIRGAPAVQNPFACSLAAADEDSCTSAQDDDGNPCVWCKFAQAGGACVSSEQASEISRVVPQVTCSDDTTTSSSSSGSSSNPVDVNCLAAGMANQDDAQTVCDSTMDANGSPCVWCNVAGISGYGVCLSSDDAAADAAKQYLTCNDNQVSTSSPWDPTCIMASFTQGGADKDSCEATMDQEGNACVWCADGNTNKPIGLCMTFDQSSVASQWLTCDSPSSDNALIQDAMDPSCLVVAYEGGNEDTCHSTDDENGNACVWCSGPSDVGICLNSDQAAMAGQWLTCDDAAAAAVALEEKEMESPLDPTCIEAGLQGDKDSCEATQDQDGNTCVWCEGGDASTGLCLNSEQASMASQWLTCDDTSLVSDSEDDDDDDDDHVTSPTDPTCVAAGYQAEGAEATCHTTNDADGNACVWCTGPSPNMGVCLSADQASIAGQWLSCDDATDDEIEALTS
mmetsp:Transcript_21680/g.39334  ORF Transcript_21680/g.39334 Transcript_21680/m.39334 type:complete len:491 (+) Transcript_21680:42-1514(+)